MKWQNETKSIHQKNKKRSNGELYEELRKQKKQAKEERLRFLESLSEAMSLPAELLAGVPVVTMHGRNAVYIENYKKIAEYSESAILIQAGYCFVMIEGKHLKVEYFSKEEMKISGMISQVSYRNQMRGEK
ncbi:MAG: YabP/YqfC family sporulation protein [Lachnospiraceae bacterium]|nr:YabP/YqfC family sporulation protein [Lachnospiraceae bacterium]